MRAAIESNPSPPYNKAQALRLYVEQSVMDDRVSEDMETYKVALEATGGTFDGVEPVSRFHEAFQAPVDAAYAAAVVGLETETFLERIRENTGLQNIGLLAMDNPNGSVKRDTWTSSFRDIISVLDYPQLVGEPPVITQPDVLPGGQVHIPDSNLRAAVAEALGKSANASITVEEMEELQRLEPRSRDIRDIAGLQFATNLTSIELTRTSVSDLSPVRGLINLEELVLTGNQVSDLSPLAGLINLELIKFSNNNVSDLSPVAALINLKSIKTWGNPVSNLSPMAGLTKLEIGNICGGDISDLSPLGSLNVLKELYLVNNRISGISPIARLTGLNRLSLERNNVSDISPLAGLTNLKWLNLHANKILDISALAELTNLTWLAVTRNEISDISPLDGLRENIELGWWDNPAFSNRGGPKIEAPWLWVYLPNTTLDNDADLLSEASGGKITEVDVATHGAPEGGSVGDEVWTSHKLPSTGGENIENMLKRDLEVGVIYGTVSLKSPREQETTMFVGSSRGLKVWLNGALIGSGKWWNDNYSAVFRVTLRQGRNVLLVALGIGSYHSNGFIGFEPGTEYAVEIPASVSYAFSQTPVHIGDTFTLDIRTDNVSDLAGWQFDIAFDPAILEAVDVIEGDFLKMDGGTTFFQSGRIDNAGGKITGLIAGRISEGGVSGSGSVLRARFKAKSEGETELTLQNFLFGSASKENISAAPLEIYVTVEERLLTGDVNRDGVVNIFDLISVAQQLGNRVSDDSQEDINGDGVVNIFDLTLVAQGIGGAAAPAVATGRADASTIEAWIAEARLTDDGSIAFAQGVQNLENLLASYIPEETALLANYPNPVNPESGFPTNSRKTARYRYPFTTRPGCWFAHSRWVCSLRAFIIAANVPLIGMVATMSANASRADSIFTS